jgi:hypothetical protein
MGCFRNVGKRAGNVSRGSVAIWLVTNIVLLISDTDFVFRFMFAYELMKEGGGFFYVLVHMAIGVLTYFAGVCYFGPQTKFRTVKQLKSLMAESPGEFRSDVTNSPTIVSFNTPLEPLATRNGRTFADLECDEHGLKDGRQGMAAWQLVHVWNYAERKTILNTCEVKHGVPFLRLAHFGCYAAPRPTDLACILNANALHTFSTGIFQVCTGVYLVFSVGNANLMVLLPLSTSLFSLVLWVFSVFLDFTGTLTEMEAEQRGEEEIKARNESKRTADMKILEDQLERKRREIESKYQGRTDAQAGIEKEDELSSASSIHFQSRMDVKKHAKDILTIEMKAYRSRLEQTKQVIKVLLARPPVKRHPSAYEDYRRHILPYQEQKDSIRADIQGKVHALDSALTADELEQALEEMNSEADVKLKILNGKIDRIKLDMMTAAGGETGPRVAAQASLVGRRDEPSAPPISVQSIFPQVF